MNREIRLILCYFIFTVSTLVSFRSIHSFIHSLTLKFLLSSAIQFCKMILLSSRSLSLAFPVCEYVHEYYAVICNAVGSVPRDTARRGECEYKTESTSLFYNLFSVDVGETFTRASSYFILLHIHLCVQAISYQ